MLSNGARTGEQGNNRRLLREIVEVLEETPSVDPKQLLSLTRRALKTQQFHLPALAHLHVSRLLQIHLRVNFIVLT